jgi:phenylpyruvate tautomerase PptA (4-oxalocrotonate tautomerase family)
MHDPDLFVCPPDKSSPALYTLVTINMFAGRSIQVKRDLYRTIVGNLESCGIPKDHVVINLIEIANENWGIQGGKPASEVDIGFKVEI